MKSRCVIKKIAGFFLVMILFSGPGAEKATAGCDSCLQAAFNSASGMIQTALEGTKMTLETLNENSEMLAKAIEEMGKTVDTAIDQQTQAYSQTLSSEGMELRKGLDAVSKSITGELVAMQTQEKGLAQAELYGIKEIVQQTLESVMKSNIFSDLSKDAQPASGGVGANRAEQYSRIPEIIDEFVVEHTGHLSDRLEEMRAIALSNEAAVSELMLSQGSEFFEPGFLRTTLLQEPRDIGVSTGYVFNLLYGDIEASDGTQKGSLKSAITDTKLSLIRDMFLEEIAMRNPTIPAEEVSMAYASVEETDEGFTSPLEMIRSEAEGRILSPAWYKELKKSNRTGLVREMTFMGATELMLMDMYRQEIEKGNRLLALIAAEKVKR